MAADREEQLKISHLMANNRDNMQALNETIILEKAEHVCCEPNYGRNWVYAYGLPYNISMEKAEEFIRSVEQTYGKVESFRLFPYSNMVEKSQKEYRFVLPE